MSNDNWKRYTDALHAMQSGVAQMQELDPKSSTAKHLRTGLNAVFSDHSALVMLLVEKKIIDHEEYMAAMAAGMEREKKSYEDLLAQKLGIKITLGS